MVREDENISLYEEQIKNGDMDTYPYDRLMIHYRKQKEYKEELRVINRGLKVFGDKLKHQQDQILKRTASRTAIKRLSDKISQLSGLSDKRGNPNYLPEPLERWTKRKITVEAKLGKKTPRSKKKRGG
jgi:hypothetical protein